MSGRALAALAAVVALAALAGVNLLVLGLGSQRHDPVGRLTPVVRLPEQAAPPAPSSRPSPPATLPLRRGATELDD